MACQGFLLQVSNYFPLNLPEGTTQGPTSFRGEKVNFRCKNSLKMKYFYGAIIVSVTHLIILGTLHHHGSITGFRIDLKDINQKLRRKIQKTSWGWALPSSDKLDKLATHSHTAIAAYYALTWLRWQLQLKNRFPWIDGIWISWE